jgi:hypothetical protein
MTQGPGRNINLKIALQNQPSQIEKTRLEWQAQFSLLVGDFYNIGSKDGIFDK